MAGLSGARTPGTSTKAAGGFAADAAELSARAVPVCEVGSRLLSRRSLLRGAVSCAAFAGTVCAGGILAGCTGASVDGGGSGSATGATGAGSAGVTARTAPAELRIGFFQSPNAELLAKGTGALQRELPHTKVSYVMFDVGRDVLVAMASGSIDIATIGMPPGVLGLTDSLPYKLYYLHDLIGLSEALVVKVDSGIRRVEDLKGRTIATAFGSTSHYSLLAALAGAGVGEDELTLLDMTGPDILAAWQRGDIDGTYIWQPAQANLLAQGGRIITDSHRVAQQTGSVTGEFGIARNEYAERYPGVLRAYIRVLDEATRAYREAGPSTVKILAGELGLTEEMTAKVIGQIGVLDAGQQRAYFGDGDVRGKLPAILKRTNDYLYRQSSVTRTPGEGFFDRMLLKGLYGDA